MNVERMHAVARKLLEDLQATNLPGLMRQLADALTNAVNAPQEPSYQTTVSDTRSQILSALQSSVVNRFSPIERQVLVEWGVDHLVAPALAEHLEEVFLNNQVTLATARDEVQQLVDPLDALVANLSNLVTSLVWFGISSEELGVGEFEVDLLIPRSVVKNELGALGKEFSELQRILQPLVELATGSRPPLEVRSIGSSDFTVFLWALPAAAVTVAKAVDEVLKVYERILNIRKVKADIEALALPDGEDAMSQATGSLEGYANTAMQAGITEIAARLVAEHASTRLPEGRPAELEIEITRSLTAIAGRIDDGYNISVRSGPLPPAEEGVAAEADSPELTNQVNEVESRRQSLSFMNLSGSPILSLPAPVDEQGTDESPES